MQSRADPYIMCYDCQYPRYLRFDPHESAETSLIYADYYADLR
jgi:hypothetical protein